MITQPEKQQPDVHTAKWLTFIEEKNKLRMEENKGAFRFTYFTDKYDETFRFYMDKLAFELGHSWDRNKHDRGAVFKAGAGLIEILHRPESKADRYVGLDYRSPKGCLPVFRCGI